MPAMMMMTPIPNLIDNAGFAGIGNGFRGAANCWRNAGLRREAAKPEPHTRQ